MNLLICHCNHESTLKKDIERNNEMANDSLTAIKYYIQKKNRIKLTLR